MIKKLLFLLVVAAIAAVAYKVLTSEAAGDSTA